MKFYAHTKKDEGPDKWQELQEHLENVSKLAASFASPFNASEWGRLVGCLHDVGKHSSAFQKRLTGENRHHADHKGAGAKLFHALGSGAGLVGAYCVAGHHGGLPDYYGGENGKSLGEIIKGAAELPEEIAPPLDHENIPPLPFQPTHPFQCAFLTRMLFSALVDADYLDTEAFVDTARSSWRITGPSIEMLAEALEHKLSSFTRRSRINDLRAQILASCREKASLSPGLFTLTVPTGGGKTLSSMAFALEHARRHGKRRVVYVIPYTSIIEQNAKVFRDVFPEHSVIEHHSTFDDEKSFGDENGGVDSSAQQRHRLACENWDSPVVVTTNVQFFESLFAARPSRCRKLHNLADSVIILDEAQMLPVDFLNPCLRALEELSTNYGASIVLCTATQPALNRQENFSCGLDGLDASRELAPDPHFMHEAFQRTRLNDLGELSLSDLADMIREREQVLCIVNTRDRAARLYRLLEDDPDCRHLSALMCPAHRSEKLEDIRATLADKQPCRVVSTQLVEAGVDISFPEVIREISGLDSITQAAGRCNREGELEGRAPVHIFTPSEGLARAFSAPAEHTGAVLRTNDADPFSPDAIRHYFRLHYWLEKEGLDRKQVMRELTDPSGQWSFRKAEKKFRLIENTMVPIIVPYGKDAADLVDSLRYSEHPGGILRRLQQYTVQVYKHQFDALDAAGAIELVAGTYPVLCDMGFYNDTMGLTFPESFHDRDFIL